jgi:hypothetical protein
MCLSHIFSYLVKLKPHFILTSAINSKSVQERGNISNQPETITRRETMP